MPALAFLLHIATNWRYGYFRDELYYLDCGRHLAWGYADMAPFVPLLARIGLLLGGSLTAIRWGCDVGCALMVLLTILIARELGGGRFAQALAGLCALLAPALLINGDILTTNVFEPVFWMGCVWMVMRIARTGESRHWLWFGVFAGLGIENKHSALFFLVAMLGAVLLTPLRRELRTRVAVVRRRRDLSACRCPTSSGRCSTISRPMHLLRNVQTDAQKHRARARAGISSSRCWRSVRCCSWCGAWGWCRCFLRARGAYWVHVRHPVRPYGRAEGEELLLLPHRAHGDRGRRGSLGGVERPRADGCVRRS